ncbi:hypothetical protein C8Q73DRAFT_665204 [Cubamyces lactineus]|nr:hypothetical protein C8Q73DRAFT_665204 [Cubamyces lactineus]
MSSDTDSGIEHAGRRTTDGVLDWDAVKSDPSNYVDEGWQDITLKAPSELNLVQAATLYGRIYDAQASGPTVRFVPKVTAAMNESAAVNESLMKTTAMATGVRSASATPSTPSAHARTLRVSVFPTPEHGTPSRRNSRQLSATPSRTPSRNASSRDLPLSTVDEETWPVHCDEAAGELGQSRRVEHVGKDRLNENTATGTPALNTPLHALDTVLTARDAALPALAANLIAPQPLSSNVDLINPTRALRKLARGLFNPLRLLQNPTCAPQNMAFPVPWLTFALPRPTRDLLNPTRALFNQTRVLQNPTRALQNLTRPVPWPTFALRKLARANETRALQNRTRALQNLTRPVKWPTFALRKLARANETRALQNLTRHIPWPTFAHLCLMRTLARITPRAARSSHRQCR